jgi:hypothetical protein
VEERKIIEDGALSIVQRLSLPPAAASRTSEVIVIDKYPGKNGGHTAIDLKVLDCLRFILSKQSV